VKVYTAVLRKEGYYYSSYGKNDAEPTIDIEKRIITAEISFIAESDGHSNQFDQLDWPVTIAFTPEMLGCIKKLEDIKLQGDNAKKDLGDVNRQIAELPHKGDAIQSALTRATLSGKLQNTADVLAIIETSVECLRLPPAVRQRLALPEPTRE
jgi:hypothetical protein